ncbi:hypothetical protein [Afifella sp. YEN Y35]|uniref:hypothetical protein n=1 Tax=Afifella sp. YEN Y35 TaxID=3388337 RepID=UPI0039E00EE5
MAKAGPFTADHVGSFLRQNRPIAARKLHIDGNLGDEALREIEDERILEVVRKQVVHKAEEIGRRAITDGQFHPLLPHRLSAKAHQSAP